MPDDLNFEKVPGDSPATPASGKPMVFSGGPYGDYTVHSETGVDLSRLKANLKLTVTERWERNFQALEGAEAFREAGRAQRQRGVAKAGRT